MTGRYPHEFGAPYNLPNSGHGIEQYNQRGVDVSETLISKVLQQAGYFTGAIGKWHMGIQQQFHPNSRGFDQYYGFLGGGHDYFPSNFKPAYQRQVKLGNEHINDYLLPLEHNGQGVDENEYITDALSREAANFVEQAAGKEQPFFLYVAYNAPHTPLQAKEEDMAEFVEIKDEKRRTYAGMVYAVDRGVGRIVDTLKTTGSFDDTLIIFLSDNGGRLDAGATNTPLKEGKGSVYEGGFRVPMFFHWPGHVPGGSRYPYPVTALDFYPTFAELAQASIPAGKQLDGKNIWADFVAGRNCRPEEMIMSMRHRNGYHDVGARQDQWKLCRAYRQKWQLFNVDSDIGEQKDLSEQQPELLRAMVTKVHEWSRSHTEPLWFHALEARDEWKKTEMPNFELTFSIDE
jgi:arylsulfatase A-like enzyme